MARIRNDPTIYVGLRLYDGTDFDTVVDRVAHGGFGVIAFGPNRRNQNRMVAYKTLRRDLLIDEQTRASFVRECLLWIGLWDHPNIAQAYAMLRMNDDRGNRPFIALAYAEQGSLRDLLQAAHRKQPGGRLPLELGLHLAQQIAAGLAYLHQPDPAYLREDPTVHRDLKPENVLLTQGRAVITDFGLAKVIETSPTTLALLLAEAEGDAEGIAPLTEERVTRTTGLHTAAGVALGTCAYMPAEQWQGAHDVGPAADLYPFGVILSELLAGRHALLDLDRPYSQAAWRQAHLDPHPRPLRAVEPQIPARVEALYQRCLSRDPAARPSAAEALAELQAGAQEAGLAVYRPPEITKHSLYNEFVYWHERSIAYYNFARYDDALACSSRALALAQQIITIEPDALARVLQTRGSILVGLGGSAFERAVVAQRNGDMAAMQRVEQEATEWDRQAETTYRQALDACPHDSKLERQINASIWHELGTFHLERSLTWHKLAEFHREVERHVAAETAFAHALSINPDKPNTYLNRALNLQLWGITETRIGERAAAIAHLRQARVHAVTSLAMGDPTARGLIAEITTTLTGLEPTE